MTMSIEEMAENILQDSLYTGPGPEIPSGASVRDRCILEFNWVHEQEKIAYAMAERINHLENGGRLH